MRHRKAILFAIYDNESIQITTNARRKDTDKVLHFKYSTKGYVIRFFVANSYFFVVNKNKSSPNRRAFTKNLIMNLTYLIMNP